MKIVKLLGKDLVEFNTIITKEIYKLKGYVRTSNFDAEKGQMLTYIDKEGTNFPQVIDKGDKTYSLKYELNILGIDYIVYVSPAQNYPKGLLFGFDEVHRIEKE